MSDAILRPLEFVRSATVGCFAPPAHKRSHLTDGGQGAALGSRGRLFCDLDQNIGGPRTLVGGNVEGLELLRYSEVEQFDGSILAHEDVRRLQIAVNDRMLMCMCHGLAHIPEQPQAL